MKRDLFAIFPDLPWTRVGHPPTRDWQQLPPPPRSPRADLIAARRRVGRDTTAASTLRRIYAVALSERRRLKAGNPAHHSLDQIVELARAAM